MEKEKMELNKETAIRLWNKSFGKQTKVMDFAGRIIAKGAYNDRNSEFGWNVDHILPQSKGGKTADHNLMCCHILTNDEKADKFPMFTSNGIIFEIIKVENHYEIKKVTKETIKRKELPDHNNSINFMDSAAGVRFFKQLKGIQNKPRFVGVVIIRLLNVSNTAVIDFIEKLLDEENISYSMDKDFLKSETRIVAKNYNMPLKEDAENLLDKCILLNTYLKKYFVPMDYVYAYEVCYQLEFFNDKSNMYLESQKISYNKNRLLGINGLEDALFINSLVYINTEAKEREPNLDFKYNEYCRYDYTFSKLSRNLEKEVNEK